VSLLISYSQFQYHLNKPDQGHVRQILQDVDLNVYTTTTNPQDKLPSTKVCMPHTIPIGMLVAVRPETGSTDPFWLARVTDLTEKGVYKLHYYKYHPANKCWKPGRGSHWKGSCSYGSILYAGINLNENSTMAAASARHVQYFVRKDKHKVV
jgi:hypothetical protein